MTTIKKILLVTAVILVQVSTASSQTSQNNFPVLKGPCLGQKPTGLTPEIFAPGIVSTSYYNHCTISISPDGSEIFWAMAPLDSPACIYISKIDNGVWTRSDIISFTLTEDGDCPVLSPDGGYLIFCRNGLLISFKQKNGSWTKAEYMGNSFKNGICPYVR